MSERLSREAALRSLEGLALGDAFGELFFRSTGRTFEELAPGPWRWTDDTHMALSIVEVLERFGAIDQDALAQVRPARSSAASSRMRSTSCPRTGSLGASHCR